MKSKKTVVLMYHDVIDKTDNSSGFQNESAFQYKVEITAFEEHVRALVGKNVLFTFDDGGTSFYTKIAPILEKYGFNGVFFISTKYLNTPGFLTTNQLKALAERGHIIGSHAHSHPSNMTELFPAQIKEEWSKSVEILSDIIGCPIHTASIPNGYVSKSVIFAAFSVGIKELYSSEPTMREKHYVDGVVIGRYVVLSGMGCDDVLHFFNPYNRLIIKSKWIVLELVKRILGNKYNDFKTKILRH